MFTFLFVFCRHQPVLARLANWEAITAVFSANLLLIISYHNNMVIVPIKNNIGVNISNSMPTFESVSWSQKRIVIILSCSPILTSHALPGNLTIMPLVLLQSMRYYF